MPRLWTGWQRNRGSIPGKGKKFYLVHMAPRYALWSTPSLLFNRHRGLFNQRQRCWGANLNTQYHPVQKQINEAPTFTSTHLQAFMVCCWITDRDFTLIHNSSVYYHIHNNPPTVLIPSKINRSQILFPYNLFQFILPCLGLPKVSFPQDSRLQSRINFSSFPPIIHGAVHPMLLALITVIIYGHSKNYEAPHYAVFFSRP